MALPCAPAGCQGFGPSIGRGWHFLFAIPNAVPAKPILHRWQRHLFHRRNQLSAVEIMAADGHLGCYNNGLVWRRLRRARHCVMPARYNLTQFFDQAELEKHDKVHRGKARRCCDPLACYVVPFTLRSQNRDQYSDSWVWIQMPRVGIVLLANFLDQGEDHSIPAGFVSICWTPVTSLGKRTRSCL